MRRRTRASGAVGSLSGTAQGWLRLPEGVRSRFTDEIREIAARHGVAADLVEAVIRVESAFNPRAVSNKGAQGLDAAHAAHRLVARRAQRLRPAAEHRRRGAPPPLSPRPVSGQRLARPGGLQCRREGRGPLPRHSAVCGDPAVRPEDPGFRRRAGAAASCAASSIATRTPTAPSPSRMSRGRAKLREPDAFASRSRFQTSVEEAIQEAVLHEALHRLPGRCLVHAPQRSALAVDLPSLIWTERRARPG